MNRPIGDPPGCTVVRAVPDPDPDPDFSVYPLAVLADWIAADLRRTRPATEPEGAAAMPIRPENRDRYPRNWKAISLDIRTNRAQGRCECLGECGRGTHPGRCPNLNGGKAYATGSAVVLTVAHLDHTPENCDPANLRAMCQGCHLHYDRDHHRETAAATRRAATEAAGQLAFDA